MFIDANGWCDYRTCLQRQFAFIYHKIVYLNPGLWIDDMHCMHTQTIDDTKVFFSFLVSKKNLRAENQNNCFCYTSTNQTPFQLLFPIDEVSLRAQNQRKKKSKQNQVGGVILLNGYFCNSVHS